MDVAGVLQEAGDGDSRARTRSQVEVEYNIIPYTSTSITLPYLWQGYHGHCIVTSNDRKLGGGSFILRFGWGIWGWVLYFFIFCYVFVLLLIVLSWFVNDRLLRLFHCSFFAFFVSGLFN